MTAVDARRDRAAAGHGPPPTLRFPPGFVWGAATAAYQIEGAHDRGRPHAVDLGHVLPHAGQGRGRRHRRRRRRPLPPLPRGRGADAPSSASASYRFSVAWPRITPDVTAEVARPGERRGLALLRPARRRAARRRASPPRRRSTTGTCRRRSRTRGGWTEPRAPPSGSASTPPSWRGHLGDRLSTVITLNEPWCSAYLGYASGVHAPGRTEPAAALAAVHHLNLAHGLAGGGRPGALAGHPGGDHPQPGLGAARGPGRPRRRRRRPPRRRTAEPGVPRPGAPRPRTRPTCWPTRPASPTGRSCTTGDLELVHQPDRRPRPELLLAHRRPAWDGTGPRVEADGHGSSAHSPWVGSDDLEFPEPEGPLTAMGWPIDADGLHQLLVRLHQEAPGVPLHVTENGAAYPDVVTPDGAVHDSDRIDYVDEHLRAVHRRDRRRRRRARLLPVVAARQLRVGATGTRSGSASCTSTTTPRSARSRTARSGTPT